jgi:hypothetical protein
MVEHFGGEPHLVRHGRHWHVFGDALFHDLVNFIDKTSGLAPRAPHRTI